MTPDDQTGDKPTATTPKPRANASSNGGTTTPPQQGDSTGKSEMLKAKKPKS